MPTYEFYDKEIDEYFELSMSISKKEYFLKDNPQVEQVFLTPTMIVASVGTIDGKIDKGMEENIQRIAEAHPYSPLAERYKRRDSKDVIIDKVRGQAKKTSKDKFYSSILQEKKDKHKL